AIWSDVTRRIAALRDNAESAESEFQLKLDPTNPGITPKITFDLGGASERGEPDVAVGVKRGVLQASATGTSRSTSESTSPAILTARPRVAILREQGVNGQIEMAAAFTRAGFKAVDVHMTDILSGRISLRDFRGIVACGGFSYGDVL